MNIAAGSMGDAEQDPRQFDVQRAADTLAAHSDVLVGIKTAHYWTRDAWDDLHTPWASVDAAVEAGERSGRPIMVDFWPRPPERSYADLILKHMRPGDVHTHVFAQQFPIVTPDGGVYDYLWQARDRGVLFDLGHGGASFWFRNAVPAIEHGFPPDSISTDLHLSSLNGAALDTLNTALTDPFDIVSGMTSNQVKDAYNAIGDPSAWASQFKGKIATNLAILDSPTVAARALRVRAS